MNAIVIPDGFSREELLVCVDREIRYRERALPFRVEAGHMSRAESAREMSRMKAIRAVIAQLPPTQPSDRFDARARAAGNDK